jgi:hypothetical protein
MQITEHPGTVSKRSYFAVRKFRVQLSVRGPAILTEVFRCPPQSNKENSGKGLLTGHNRFFQRPL